MLLAYDSIESITGEFKLGEKKPITTNNKKAKEENYCLFCFFGEKVSRDC